MNSSRVQFNEPHRNKNKPMTLFGIVRARERERWGREKGGRKERWVKVRETDLDGEIDGKKGLGRERTREREKEGEKEEGERE